jgi:prevent-host-death family protein
MGAISVEELARRPTRLIEEAESGQVAVVTKDGRPLFLLSPTTSVLRTRKFTSSWRSTCTNAEW